MTEPKTTPKTNKTFTSPEVRRALAQATVDAREFARRRGSEDVYERRRGSDSFILGSILQRLDYTLRAKRSAEQGGEQ